MRSIEHYFKMNGLNICRFSACESNEMKFNSILTFNYSFLSDSFQQNHSNQNKMIGARIRQRRMGEIVIRQSVGEREYEWMRQREREDERGEREMVYAVGIDQQSTLTIKPPKEDFPLLLPTSLNGFITRQIHCNSKISTFIDKSTHTHIVRKASQIGIICDKCYCLPRNDDINVVCVREYSQISQIFLE